jgi:hypothetical protein
MVLAMSGSLLSSPISIAINQVAIIFLNRYIPSTFNASLFTSNCIGDGLIFLNSTLANGDFARHHRRLGHIDLLLADRDTDNLILADRSCIIYLASRDGSTLDHYLFVGDRYIDSLLLSNNVLVKSNLATLDSLFFCSELLLAQPQ